MVSAGGGADTDKLLGEQGHRAAHRGPAAVVSAGGGGGGQTPVEGG